MSDHRLTYRQFSDGYLTPACTCGWYSVDASHWRFERHLAAVSDARDRVLDEDSSS